MTYVAREKGTQMAQQRRGEIADLMWLFGGDLN
jgi:hypothetical protein